MSTFAYLELLHHYNTSKHAFASAMATEQEERKLDPSAILQWFASKATQAVAALERILDHAPSIATLTKPRKRKP